MNAKSLLNLVVPCLLAVPMLAPLSGCGDDAKTNTDDPAPRLAYIPNAGDGTLSVIDMDTLTVVRTVTVSEGEGASTSHGVAVSADGTRVFVGDALRGVLKVYETTTFDTVAEVWLGISVHGIDITTDASRVVASGSRLPEKDHKFTLVVDTETQWVLAQIDTNMSGHGDTTPDGRYMYVNDATAATDTVAGNRIGVVDLVDNEMVTTLVVGPDQWAEGARGPNEVVFAPDGQTAYTADYAGQCLSILDTSNPRAPIKTGLIEMPNRDSPHGIDITSDGQQLWVSNRKSHDVSVIVPSTGEEIDLVSTDPYEANHVSLTPDGSQAWVTLTATDLIEDKTGYILVLDVNTREELARIPVGISPHEISFED